MIKPNPPCQNCQDRWVSAGSTCHGTCEKYTEYRRLNEMYRAEVERTKFNSNGTQWYKTCTGWWRKK